MSYEQDIVDAYDEAFEDGVNETLQKIKKIIREYNQMQLRFKKDINPILSNISKMIEIEFSLDGIERIL